MPLVLNFFRFALGGAFRFLPLLFGLFATFFKKVSANKWIQKNWPWLIGVLVVIYVLYIREEKGLLDDLKKDGRAAEVAVLVSKLLGTHKDLSWWQPSTWSEDEDGALNLLLEHKDKINAVEREYNKISKSGSLRSDVERLFSSKQISQLYGAIN